ERTGILALILPELGPGFDAWAAARRTDRAAEVAHWLARVDAAPASARLGALLAELADPDPMLRRLCRASQRRADGLLRRLKFSNDESQAAAILVGVAGSGLSHDWTDAVIRRLLADIGRGHAGAAVALWRADGALDLADRTSAI